MLLHIFLQNILLLSEQGLCLHPFVLSMAVDIDFATSALSANGCKFMYHPKNKHP